MKKLLVLLLLMVSTTVFAEWTKVDGSEVSGAYVDFQTIRKKGNKTKMWRLFDFTTVMNDQGYKYRSSVTRHEYHCEENTLRMLDIALYSGNMESGIAIYVNNNIKMEPESIIPNTVGETIFKIACGKK